MHRPGTPPTTARRVEASAPRPPLRGVLALVLALCWLGLCWLALTPPAAVAAEPLRLDDQLTDEVQALTGREDEARQALQSLRAEQGVQLFVVFVDDFSGLGHQAWADRTAELSGLGTDDVLLAVAVEERSYAYSVDEQFRLSDAELAEVARVAIEPALARSDWAGAVVAAAEGYEAQLGGGTVGRGGGGSAGPLLLGVGALGAAAVLGGMMAARRRRSAGDGRGPAGGAPGEQPSLAELDSRANALLVRVDDSVRTAEREVAFAEAEFGESQVAAYRAALAEARSSLTDAFRIRQQLDDTEPEPPQQRHAMLTEIIRRCEASGRALNEHAEEFSRLRDLTARAPVLLDALDSRAATLETRVAAARATLDGLSTRYEPSALAPFARNPDLAVERLDFARRAVQDGRTAVSGGPRGQAALAVRAAEEALAQAERLLVSAERAGSELADAVTRLPAAVADLEDDLRAAAELASGAGEAGPREHGAAVEQARAAVALARERGPSDPVGTLRAVTQANTAMDAALAGAREAELNRRRAQQHLEPVLHAARAEVAAAEDLVDVNRGMVGSAARTRLAQAQQRLAEAEDAAPRDPVAAIRLAQEADHLAEAALQAAHADLGPVGFPGGVYTGGYGGAYGGSWGGAWVGGGGLLEAVLRGGFSGGGYADPGWGGSGRSRRGAGGGFSRRSASRGGSFGRSSGGRRGGGGRF